MTCRELAAIEYPGRVDQNMIDPMFCGGVRGCPHNMPYNYKHEPDNVICCGAENRDCTKCWDQEIKPTDPGYAKVEAINKLAETGHVYPASSKEIKQILDSGDRTEFDTGAVRDMHAGKGRCDLMPLDVVGEMYTNIFKDESGLIFYYISEFQRTDDISHLMEALHYFCIESDFKDHNDMFLEVAKHFEEGAVKYGENNWQKGIPTNVYIDSAVRHLLKYCREDEDERHDRAFCWNIMCCIWTCLNRPELDVYRKDEE